MRVDNSNLTEITQTKKSVEIKGNVAVLTEETTVRKAEPDTGRVSSVQQTTVDRPFFSGESQLEQIRQEAENMEAQLLQQKMQAVSNTVTAADGGKLDQDGYPVNDTEVDTIVTVVDKIKVELAKAGMDISVFGDTLDAEQIEKIAAGEPARQGSWKLLWHKQTCRLRKRILQTARMPWSRRRILLFATMKRLSICWTMNYRPLLRIFIWRSTVLAGRLAASQKASI